VDGNNHRTRRVGESSESFEVLRVKVVARFCGLTDFKNLFMMMALLEYAWWSVINHMLNYASLRC